MKVKRNVFAVVGWVAWNLAGVLGVKYAIDKLTGRDHHYAKPSDRQIPPAPPAGSPARGRWRRRGGRDDGPG
jgi:hypothetical protein